MEEIWREIKEFEGYMVSNNGIIKSLARLRKTRNNSLAPVKERILKVKKDKNGYLQVGLCKNGKVYWKKIHRLVAEAFIPNPDKLPCVNHKNEIKNDNRAENLEFCSHKYNSNYGTAIERSRLKRLNGKGSKPIIQKTLKNEIVAEYPSIKEAARQTGYFKQGIIPCLKGKLKQAYGYLWQYKEVA